MNLHIPQTEEAQTETKLLMSVPTQIRSPRFSGPIIGCNKDHLTGLYLLTEGDKEFTREEAVELIRYCDPEIEIPKKEKFTGKEIFSLFLPEDFNIEYKAGPYNPHVQVKDGELVDGAIDKKGVAAFDGKMLDELDNKYGQEFTKEFLFNISKLALKFLTDYGFSISVSDQDLDEKTRKRINKTIEKAREEVDEMIEDFKEGEVKAMIGRTPRESLETLVRRKLSKSLNEISDIVEKRIPDNNTIKMAKSGARGSMINFVQCVACIGQETRQGERIDLGFHDRTFSHFKEGDMSVESKGFVKSGYKQGLNPFEFFFDSMNSREGLMDKSLKTRHSGYLERRLIAALKDLRVEYDGTVRDAGKKIVQFVPGEDGLDPSKIQKGGIDVEKIAGKLFG